MDATLRNTVAWLEHRISVLQRAKDTLLEVAQAEGPGETQVAVSRRLAGEAPKRRTRPSKAKKTRKRLMIDFIRENGPATRREIIEGTGIPMGTVAYCLNDKKTFIRSEDGRWDVRKETKPAELVQHQKAG